MRLAFLPSSYLPDTLGGTEVYVHHLAEELAHLGHAVAVVVHGGSLNGEPPSPLYHVERLPPLPPPRRAELYARTTVEPPPGFSAFLDSWRPNVLHFHAFTRGAGLGHARLARGRGLPYFVTYHTPTMSCPRGTLLRHGRTVCDGLVEPRACGACLLDAQGWPRPLAALLARSPLSHAVLPEGPWLPRLALPSLLGHARDHWHEFMGGARHLVACAGWCRDVLIRNGIPPERVTVHRQALPGPARSRTLRLPLPFGDRPIRLGFFGRVTPVKGPDLLLAAARRLRQDGLDVACELAGPVAGPDRLWADGLLARDAGRTGYLGSRQGPELRAWIASLDLAVIPSRWLETGPLTLLEAWDEGTPAIGADLGGIADSFHAAGLPALLFAPDDAAALADAVRRAAAWAGPPPTVALPGVPDLARAMLSLYAA